MDSAARPILWPLLLALAILTASGQPRLAAPSLGFTFSYDKLAHLLVFGLLATAILRQPRLLRLGWAGVALSVLAVSAFGAFDEFRQSMTPGRSVEFGDWLADSLGALLASVLYFKWRPYRQLLEWPIPENKRLPKPSEDPRKSPR